MTTRVKSRKTNDREWLADTTKYFKTLYDLWAPLEPMSVSQWADGNLRLSAESSSEWGKWSTDRAPYQREMMDSISDPEVERVVFMTSSQIGKSSILNAAIGRFVSRDPCPIMMVQPTIAMGKSYSKQRITPMIRDTPDLTPRFITPLSTRRANDTLFEKLFIGGVLVITGANSAAGLASRPIRVLMFDEVDRAPDNAKQTGGQKEGDPVDIAEKRTATFSNRKIILSSTPLLKGRSRIEAAYLNSSQGVWEKQCPQCKTFHQLLWDENIRYESNEQKTQIIADPVAVCTTCGAISSEAKWKQSAGRWRHRVPDNPVRGYHLNVLVSPWLTWKEIAQSWLDAQGDSERLQVFVNTYLGKTWEIPGEVIEESTVNRRRELYDSQVPDDVLVLTMGVDVQDDRLEYAVMGYGLGKESWGIEYGKIYGDTTQVYDRTTASGETIPCVWSQLDAVRTKNFYRNSGMAMNILRTCVDSGGHATTAVYQFCRRREPTTFAIKGVGGAGKSIIYGRTKTQKESATLFTIGTITAKDTLYSRLKIEHPQAGYCHYPTNVDAGFDEQFFAQLTNEKKVRAKNKHSFWTYEYEVIAPGLGNEGLDTTIYALAAFEILNPTLEKMAERMAVNSRETPTDATRIVAKPRSLLEKKPILPHVAEAVRLRNERMRRNTYLDV